MRGGSSESGIHLALDLEGPDWCPNQVFELLSRRSARTRKQTPNESDPDRPVHLIVLAAAGVRAPGT